MREESMVLILELSHDRKEEPLHRHAMTLSYVLIKDC